MKIETQNGMLMFKGQDAFTGEKINGLKIMPVYIEINNNKDYERFWINERSYHTIVECFNMFCCNPVDIYLSFEDVQNVKANLGIKVDKRCIEAEMEEPEPFREYWWNEFCSEGDSLYD